MIWDRGPVEPSRRQGTQRPSQPPVNQQGGKAIPVTLKGNKMTGKPYKSTKLTGLAFEVRQGTQPSLEDHESPKDRNPM